MQFPTLKTANLLLRSFNQSDLNNVYKGLSNPEVTKFYAVHFDTLEATMEQMEWFDNLWKIKTGIWWAICNVETNLFYGAIGLNDISKKNRTAELGFWLLPEFWNQGIIQQTAPLVFNYAFKKLNLSKIEASVDTENSNSKRTLQKLNFEYMNTITDSELKNNKPIILDIFILKHQ